MTWYLSYGGPKGPTPSGPPVPSPFPNPGRILQNPTFLNQSGGFEFLNQMKMATGGWTDGSNNLLSPANQDANGYPTALGAGGSAWSTNVYTPDTSVAGANYVVYWNGTGTWSAYGAATFSGGGSGTNRGTFTLPAAPAQFSPVQISALPVTNIAIMLATDEADFLAGKITGSKLRQRINQAKTPVWRNLNWWGTGSGNLTNVASWADRKPAGYVSYSFDEYRSNIFAGTTSNTGLAYTASLTGFTLQDKTKVMAFVNANENNATTIRSSDGTPLGIIHGNSDVTNPNFIDWGQANGFTGNEPVGFNGFSLPAPLNQFTTYYVVGSSISGNLFKISATAGGAAITITGSTLTGVTAAQFSTLNVQGTGALVIRSTFGTVHQPNDLSQLTAGTGSIWTFIYDARFPAWHSFNNGLQNGVPPEVFMQFCQELGCHPWYDSPYYSVCPMTDWHFQLATYLKANKPSWMVPRFECINEPWNVFTPAGTAPLWGSFFNVGWGGGYDEQNFIGMIVNTIGQDVSTVMGPPDGTNYHLIANVATQPATEPDVMNASTYLSVGPVQGATAWRPGGYDNMHPTNYYLTHVACNQYFYTSGDETAGNAQWLATAPSGAAAQQAVIDGFLNTGDQFLNSNITTSFTATISGTALTVTAFGTNSIAIGQTIVTGAAAGTKITAGSGSSWTVSISQTVSSPTAMTSTALPPTTLNNGIPTATAVNNGGGLAACLAVYQVIGPWAAGFINSAGKAIGMCGYEGGYAAPTDEPANFKLACKLGTNLGTYYAQNVNNFFNQGGTIPAEFTITGPVGSTDDWSVLLDIYMTPDPPQWVAIVGFNH